MHVGRGSFHRAYSWAPGAAAQGSLLGGVHVAPELLCALKALAGTWPTPGCRSGPRTSSSSLGGSSLLPCAAASQSDLCVPLR